jgi:hypothetical protein
MLDIVMMGDAIIANIAKMRQQALDIGSGYSVSDYDGTVDGIGQVYGEALANAGASIETVLGDIKWAMAEHADALKAALDALSGTDELSAADANSLTQMIDNAVADKNASVVENTPVVRQPGGMISN